LININPSFQSFREKQLAMITNGRDIRQQIVLLKMFLSLYNNESLTKISKEYSLLSEQETTEKSEI